MHSKGMLPALFVLFVLFVPCVLPVPLHAAQVTVTPSLSFKEEYNDNIFAQTSGRRGDFVSTLSPALSLFDSSENLSATLSGGVNDLWYLRNSSNDGLGYFVRGAGGYTATPRLALSADLGGTRDIAASTTDPVTKEVTNSRTLRQNYRLGERYQVNELLSSSLNLGYGRDDYDSAALVGTSHYQANSDIGYDLGRLIPRARLVQALGFSRDATELSRVDSLSATLGLSREINELWSLSLNGGGRYTHSRFRIPGSPERGTHEEAGGVGGLALNYSGRKLSGSLALSHDLSSASGRSGATQRTGVNLALSERFTPRLSGSLGAGYARNLSARDQFGGAAIDERYWNLSGTLRYEFFADPSDLALEAGYSHNGTDYRLLGTQMNQNVVTMRLTWQHPWNR